MPQIKLLPKPNKFKAKSLGDAHKKGYFGRSMNRNEFMERITKYNPTLRWHANKTHRALYDSVKAKGFLCGIPHCFTIPEFSIEEYNKAHERKITYTNEWGEITGSEILNTEEDMYAFLARGWKAIFKILTRKGYKIDERGL
jgi:hypothetical protein